MCIRDRARLEGQDLRGHWDVEGTVDPAAGALRFVPAAASALWARQIPVPPVRLTVNSDLPPGRGLSSSAALCLAVLDALARHGGCRLERHELAELATHVERDLIGVACGPLDPLACVAGAPVLLRWRSGGQVMIERIAPALSLHLVVGSFAAPRDTPAILRVLQDHMHSQEPHHHDPRAVAAVQGALAGFGEAAELGAAALREGDSVALGLAMDRCQGAYEHMATWVPRLRAPMLQRAVAGLRKRGALGAKFSGAGGDGSVIALYTEPRAAQQSRAWLDGQEGASAWICPI